MQFDNLIQKQEFEEAELRLNGYTPAAIRSAFKAGCRYLCEVVRYVTHYEVRSKEPPQQKPEKADLLSEIHALSVEPDPAGSSALVIDQPAPAEDSPLTEAPLDNEAVELWEQALDILPGMMTKATFNQWLKRTRAQALEDGQLYVVAGSQQAKEWLEGRLLPTIQRALAQVAGPDISVTFVLGEGSGPIEQSPYFPVFSSGERSCLESTRPWPPWR